MRPLPFLACFQVRTRKLLHGFVSILVIGSMLLQPVIVIAVTYQPDRAIVAAASTIPDADENSRFNNSSAPDEMSATDRVRMAAALPKPAKRTLAQVSPTPSNAKPAYPYNHILDGFWAAAGSPPANHNFEEPPIGGGAPPYNYDFQLSAMGGGTLPLNHDL